MKHRVRGLAFPVLAMTLYAIAMAACTGTERPPVGPSPVFPALPATPVAPSTETRPSLDPSPEATEGPVAIPSRPPGTIPVYGTIRARIIPAPAPGSEGPPPIVTMRWIDPGVPGSELRQVAQNAATGDFRMVLSPFDLLVLADVELTGGPVGFESTDLPTDGPGDTDPVLRVPDATCVYAGRMTFTYVRLPGADALTQLALASDLAQGGSLSILFTSAGTLVYLPDDPSAHRIDVPPRASRPRQARGCTVDQVRFGDLTP